MYPVQPKKDILNKIDMFFVFSR